MRAEDLARLSAVAALLRERDLARLASVRGQIADIDRDLSALTEQDRAPPEPDTGLAAAGQAAERWRRWSLAERRRLQSRRAALAVEELDALAAATRAVGRDDVLKRIAGG